MTKENQNIYDFIINEDNELLLLLYARSGAPKNPSLEIDISQKQAILYRSDNDGISINDLSEDIFNILCNLSTILVCELSNEENDEEAQLTNAYEAKITF